MAFTASIIEQARAADVCQYRANRDYEPWHRFIESSFTGPGIARALLPKGTTSAPAKG
jgi:hypothetical protein